MKLKWCKPMSGISLTYDGFGVEYLRNISCFGFCSVKQSNRPWIKLLTPDYACKRHILDILHDSNANKASFTDQGIYDRYMTGIFMSYVGIILGSGTLAGPPGLPTALCRVTPAHWWYQCERVQGLGMRCFPTNPTWIFHCAEWNISLCRMEYFIMQNRIFHYAEWNILLCRMEYFIMQNGIFHYAEGNILIDVIEYYSNIPGIYVIYTMVIPSLLTSFFFFLQPCFFCRFQCMFVLYR